MKRILKQGLVSILVLVFVVALIGLFLLSNLKHGDEYSCELLGANLAVRFEDDEKLTLISQSGSDYSEFIYDYRISGGNYLYIYDTIEEKYDFFGTIDAFMIDASIEDSTYIIELKCSKTILAKNICIALIVIPVAILVLYIIYLLLKYLGFSVVVKRNNEQVNSQILATISNDEKIDENSKIDATMTDENLEQTQSKNSSAEDESSQQADENKKSSENEKK